MRVLIKYEKDIYVATVAPIYTNDASLQSVFNELRSSKSLVTNSTTRGYGNRQLTSSECKCILTSGVSEF